MQCCVWLFLVVSFSAIDWLERLVSKMTCYVSIEMLNPTHSLTHLLTLIIYLLLLLWSSSPRSSLCLYYYYIISIIVVILTINYNCSCNFPGTVCVRPWRGCRHVLQAAGADAGAQRLLQHRSQETLGHISSSFFPFMLLAGFHLSWLGYLYKLVKMLSVCVDVWMLTRVEQIVTDAHRYLSTGMHRPINEFWSRVINQVSLTYFTGQNRAPIKVGVNSHFWASRASQPMRCLFLAVNRVFKTFFV